MKKTNILKILSGIAVGILTTFILMQFLSVVIISNLNYGENSTLELFSYTYWRILIASILNVFAIRYFFQGEKYNEPI